MSISIEPTTSCNLSCPECPSGLKQFTRPTGLLQMETLDKILSELGKKLWYITFYFQGEPLIHKQFTEMVAKIKQHKIMVATSTNAHFLTVEKAKKIIDSKLDRLIVSLDAIDGDTYKKYRRGGDFDLVVNNLKSMVALKKEMKSRLPLIELQFIVFKHNENQIDAIKKFGKEIGVDKTTIKTAQLYNYELGNERMTSKLEFSRYKKSENGKIEIQNTLKNRCYRMWSGCVFTWDGKVVPCCFDKDAQHQFGELKTQTFANIWKSDKYNNFRYQILQNRKQYEICRNCSE